MNTDEAFTRGATAFYKGEPRTPMLDPALHPFTNTEMDLSSPETQELFIQWYRGWDIANLDCEESDMAEHDAAAKAEAFNEQVLTHGPYRPDPASEREEAHARWMEHLEYQQSLKAQEAMESPSETLQAIVDEFDKKAELKEGVRFNKDGSVTLSADWIMKNAEKD